MATLTQTAYYSRQAIKYGTIVLAGLLIFRAVFISFKAYWKKAHPPPPPPPTMAFGKLSRLSFPERKGLPPLSFKLETISGTLPALPDQTKVYFMPMPSSTGYFAKENTDSWAKTLGFTSESRQTDKFDYRFTSDTSPKTTLDVNILTRNFHLYYDWQSDLGILSQTPPPDQQAISLVKSFLQNANAFSEDLAEGETKVEYLKFQNGELKPALSHSEANFVKVGLFRKNLNDLSILPPNPKEANITVIMTNPNSRNRGIIEAKYTHFQISEEKNATYPLRTAQDGWSLLTNGKGFIANLGNNPNGSVTIRNVYLAYYDSDTPQNFLQPVIVFAGDNDFYAYLPAVSEMWLEELPAK